MANAHIPSEKEGPVRSMIKDAKDALASDLIKKGLKMDRTQLRKLLDEIIMRAGHYLNEDVIDSKKS